MGFFVENMAPNKQGQGKRKVTGAAIEQSQQEN